MMLAGKISLAILTVGLVAFLAVTTMNKSTSAAGAGRSLTEVAPPQTNGLGVLNDKDHDDEGTAAAAAALDDKANLGLRRRESVGESITDLVPESESDPEDASALVDNVLPKERGNSVKGSHRGLWYGGGYYPPPRPKPKPQPYRPPAPKYPPPAPKYYYPRPPPPRPSCPGGYGVTYYTCSYCPCRWNERKFNIYGCGCGCILDD